MYLHARASARANSSRPNPTKVLSKPFLVEVWRASRDSKQRAGRPGVDNVTASQFLEKIDANLDDIGRRLRSGQYGFSKLRAVFLPKPDSDKERVICIPTVRDRLVQRAIAEYLISKKIFPINNLSSFGFIRGLGPQAAIKRALEFRARYEWCLKTDIQSFFDKIPRRHLKVKVSRTLKGSSLEPLVLKAIDCEVKTSSENRAKLQRQGLIAGVGVRQGMPLSPLLANLALADFDREVERRRIGMVRYADDLVLFLSAPKKKPMRGATLSSFCLRRSNYQFQRSRTDQRQGSYQDQTLLSFWDEKSCLLAPGTASWPE